MAGELKFFEIGVADTERARTFYGSLFDWQFEPIGNGFGITAPNMRGGMHGGDAGAVPYVFFEVEDMETALDRVRDLGGDVEVVDVEGDEENIAKFGRFKLCRDNQGSPFGLHQPPAAQGEGAPELAIRRAATIDHVTLRAKDLTASRRFYEAALTPLGLGLEFEHEGLLAFGNWESGRLIIYANESRVAGVHVAFSAPSREAVDRFHAAALQAGGRENGAPGLRPEYHAGYYGAFVLDRDGNNVEAVHHTVPQGRVHGA